ncbi:MAG: PfkB family carbohydrate kinase [Schleiferiaceae bacterium]|nr:PfkB family carbohydrate kinase [Schleiferiaceae bacterium]
MPFDKDIVADFQGKKVFLIGDPMIDVYMWGYSNRMSPEAPVPVVNVERTEERLGGAANVALNLKALGAVPFLVAAVPATSVEDRFAKLLLKADLSLDGLFLDTTRKIPIKTRVISNEQHVLRVDEESILPIFDEQYFLEHCQALFEKHSFDVVLFQDYNKGLLSATVISAVIQLAQQRGIPTVVDPKKENFFSYKNVSLFKPNLKELSEGLEKTIPFSGLEAALELARNQLHADFVMVSLSEKGIAIQSKESFFHLPAFPRTIRDVSGAGDSVVSVAALALACGYQPKDIATLSNLAGGLVCESVGVVPITQAMLTKAIQQEYPF